MMEAPESRAQDRVQTLRTSGRRSNLSLMRRGFLLPALVCLCLPAPAFAGGSTGGASPDPTPQGGQEFGTPVAAAAPSRRAKRRRRVTPRRLTVGEFTVTHTIQPGGAPARFTYRINGSARAVRVRIDLVNAGRQVVKRIRLGYKRTNQTHEREWAPAVSDVPPGIYMARLHASDEAGHRLVRTASSSGLSALEVKMRPVVIGSGVFPIQGAYDFGGEEARFGDDRGDHIHQGQDILAAEGTPVVAPRAGVVFWKAYQSGGAGHYLVIRGDDGRDYVFMHLVAGSELVAKGDPVTAGQQIGQVGNTGDSRGAHLHFEIWPNGWYAKDSAPIDPRPDLEAWAAQSGVAPSY